MPLLSQRVYERDGHTNWRASIDATLATSSRLNVRLGRVSRRLVPRVGGCLKCDTSWLFVPAHLTTYRRRDYDGRLETATTFALCEACWTELPPEARVPFYRAWYELALLDTARLPYGPARFSEVARLQRTWPALELAVRAGG